MFIIYKRRKRYVKRKIVRRFEKFYERKNVIRKNVIQMVRAAILQVEKDKQIEVTDDQIIEIIAKETKKRKDSIADYEKVEDKTY